MKTLLKILLALVLLLAAGLAAVLLLVDPNDFKDDIRAQVVQATGRELTIDGNLELSLFPRLRIEVEGASLADAPGFGEEAFVRIRRAELQARLLPLLSGRLEVDAVLAEGLAVRLIRDAQGRGNWEGLGPKPVAEATRGPAQGRPPPSPSTAPSATPSATPSAPPYTARPDSPAEPRQAPAREVEAAEPSLSLGRLELTDMQVTWEDRRADAHLALHGLTLTAGPIAPGRPVALSVSGTFAEANGLKGRLALDGTLAPGASRDTFVLSPFALQLDELTRPDGLRASGTLQGELRGDLSTRRYDSEGLALRLEAAGGPIASAPLVAEARGGLALDLAAQTLALKGLDVRADSLHLTGEAAGAGILGEAVVKGRLVLDPLDLRAWLDRHGLPLPATPDPKALARIALVTDWRAAAGRLDLTGLDLTLDETHVKGSAGLVPTEPPRYRFDLTLDRLDLDRYLPSGEASPGPAGGERRPVAARASGRRAGDTAPADTPKPTPTAMEKPKTATETKRKQDEATPLLPTTALRSLDLEGKLRAAHLKAAGVTLGDAALAITAKGGRLTLEDKVRSFYEGSLKGRMGLDATADPPTLTLAQKATGIQVGPLLRDLGDEDRLSGQGNLEVDLTATGHSSDALKRSLSGRVSVQLADGKVKGFNLEHRILQAEARLKGESAPAKGAEETDFTQLSASGWIANGMLTSRDLVATSVYIHATGEGRIDIAAERLDYVLRPRFVDPPKGRGIKEIEDIPVPIHITGTFDRPEWEIELGPVLKEVARRRIERELDKGDTLKQLEERTGIKGLEQGIRGLFGR